MVEMNDGGDVAAIGDNVWALGDEIAVNRTVILNLALPALIRVGSHDSGCSECKSVASDGRMKMG